MRTLRIFGLLCSLLFSLIAAAKPPGGGWPDLSIPAPAQGGGEKDAALIIGIEEYDNLAKIPGAVENAKEWYEYFTKTRGLDPSRVFLLTNKDAYAEEIDRKVKAVTAAAPSGGTLWVIFIGHGYSGKDDDKKASGILVGVDAKPDYTNLSARGISQSKLFKVLAAGKQNNTNIILDACFSGRTPQGNFLLDDGTMVVVVAPPAEEMVKKAVPQPKQKSFLVLTASDADQFAGALPAARRPAFSYLLLGAMRGWAANGDGVVTAQEAIDYATEMLRHAKNRVQTPQLKGKPTQVIATGKEERPSPSLIPEPDQEPIIEVPAPVSVQLSIKSEPDNADIFLDNKYYGITPLELYLPKGERAIEVRVSKDGFAAQAEDFLPQEDKAISAKLMELPKEKPPAIDTGAITKKTQKIVTTLGLSTFSLASTSAAFAITLRNNQSDTRFGNTGAIVPSLSVASGLSMGGAWWLWQENWRDKRAPLVASAATFTGVTGLSLMNYWLAKNVDGEPLPDNVDERAGLLTGLVLIPVSVSLSIYARSLLRASR